VLKVVPGGTAVVLKVVPGGTAVVLKVVPGGTAGQNFNSFTNTNNFNELYISKLNIQSVGKSTLETSGKDQNLRIDDFICFSTLFHLTPLEHSTFCLLTGRPSSSPVLSGELEISGVTTLTLTLFS
jgi:hypothetical protein